MKKKKDLSEKIVIVFVIVAIMISIFAIFYTVKSLFFPSGNSVSNQILNQMDQRLSRMSLTPFDFVLAKEFMDKNNDGKCDACGMDVEQCIDSGQLQCNMDSKSTIGILGSQHIHADWKIYIDGKELKEDFFEPISMDMAKIDNRITSSFIHLDKMPSEAQEKVGDVLHMHATGVPIWIFFKSVGMEFKKDCLKLQDGQEFCNNGKKTLKFYVNGLQNFEYGNYVFKDDDKILITDGNGDLQEQLNSITDYAKNH